MVFAITTDCSGTADGIAAGGLEPEGDPMQIYNPEKLQTRILKRAAGGESMTVTTAKPAAPANRATVADLPVQPPFSPARFDFPAPADRRVMSEDDRIASIVARALAELQTKQTAAAPAVAPAIASPSAHGARKSASVWTAGKPSLRSTTSSA